MKLKKVKDEVIFHNINFLENDGHCVTLLEKEAYGEGVFKNADDPSDVDFYNKSGEVIFSF